MAATPFLNHPDNSIGAEKPPLEFQQLTGLRHFGARYYGSRIGRFTTVDPLQISAAVTDPQQWNRYSYSRNNPLRYLDPTGLYVFDEGATSDDKNAFRRGLREAAGARKGLSGSQRDAVDRAVAAYGAEGEANGVTVGFGALDKGKAGDTSGRLDAGTLGADVRVTFDLRQSGGTLAVTVAHEGSHAADFQAYYAALGADPRARIGRSSVTGGPLDLTKYETETRAYNVSAFTAMGLGIAGLRVGGQDILNRGLVDAQAIDKLLGDPKGLYHGTTPSNPGHHLSGE